jgi:hypothetical protein
MHHDLFAHLELDRTYYGTHTGQDTKQALEQPVATLWFSRSA